jgi:membrane-associated phospholipid phosphatase
MRITAVALLVALTPMLARAEEPPAAEPAKNVPAPRDDKRRTVRSYGTNLVHNIVAVPGNAAPSLVITAAITAPALAWDANVEQYFAEHPHETWGEVGSALGGGLAIGGLTLGFFAAGRLASGDRFRAATYDVSQAIIVTELYTTALKLAIRRERPDGSNHLSFPSGHASSAFAIAGVISHHYGLRAEIVSYSVASFIALSRCAANKHHFSDVIAGSGLGLAVGRTVARRNGRPPSKPPGKEPGVDVSVGFDAGPAGDGQGIVLRVAY